MSVHRLGDYLGHMLEAVDLACSYVEGMTKEDFLDDKRTQQAVVLNLIVVGEAATKILKEYEAFANLNADVPWASMKGMRNRIAHGSITTSTLIRFGKLFRLRCLSYRNS